MIIPGSQYVGDQPRGPASSAASAEHQPNRSASPDEGQEDGQTGERKRKRKALSCYTCRRRKLKCDRIFPSCGRCVKSGQADACNYDTASWGLDDGEDPNDYANAEDGERPSKRQSTNNVHSSTNGSGPTSGSASLFRAQEQRIAQLEDVISSMQMREARRTEILVYPPAHRKAQPKTAGNTSSPFNVGAWMIDSGVSSSKDADTAEMMLFRGSSFRTKFSGTTCPASLISSCKKLQELMRGFLKSSATLVPIRNEFRSVRSKKKALDRMAKVNTPNYPTDADLIPLLPDRDMIGKLVDIYFDTIETTYRILHRPSFLADLGKFWQERQTAPRPGFVALLLLVISAVNCPAAEPPFTFMADSSSTREQSVRWIRAVESWSRVQSQKHLTLQVYQVRCLLVLSKRINDVKKKQAWEEAHALLTMGVAAGMHRDPSMMGDRITPFHSEMRKRLWATMVEIELQASIDRGMTSSSSLYASDCPPPLNVDDQDLNEPMQNLPQAKPSSEYTPTSFLHISARSVGLRKRLTALLNDHNYELSFEDLLEFEDQINAALRDLPQWKTRSPAALTTNSFTLPKAILGIQLRQFLVLMHSLYMQKREPSSRLSYCRVACLEACKAILEQDFVLQETSPLAFRTLGLMRADFDRACLAICRTIFLAEDAQISLNYVQPYTDLIEKSLDLFDDRILRLGRELDRYWFLCSALAFTYSSTPESEKAAKAAIDRVQRMYYQIMASQEAVIDEPTPKSQTQQTAWDLPMPSPENNYLGFQLDPYWNFDLLDFSTMGDATQGLS